MLCGNGLRYIYIDMIILFTTTNGKFEGRGQNHVGYLQINKNLNVCRTNIPLHTTLNLVNEKGR